MKYSPSKIEARWQREWEKYKFHSPDLAKAKKPFYNLMMFPYPSGAGLHVGHVYAFSGADTFGRFMRRQGFDVFEPMGFDAFGIHGENYALKINKHPKEVTAETTKFFREEQLKKLGMMFDWSREINTTLPEYYKWNQWLFLEFLKAGLAVRKKAPVNWCPSCKTVLADEQTVGGRCERCDSEVAKREIEQWFFKITDYAERLDKNLDKIDWSEKVKKLQRAWIGRSEGAEVKFWLPAVKKELKVFTTRLDTIFGVTYIALAPEHALLKDLVTPGQKEAVNQFLAEHQKRQAQAQPTDEKFGVFTGSHAINPLSGALAPIWVADYVLAHYGGGAVMGVPAHDTRDFNFAKKYNLPIEEVIDGKSEVRSQKSAYDGEGTLANSGEFTGLESAKARLAISKWLKAKKLGQSVVTYRLRDWLISRQRYWATPIPVIYCRKCLEVRSQNSGLGTGNKKLRTTHYELRTATIDGVEYAIIPVPEKDLPVLLPETENFRPAGTGKSPLASIDAFVHTKCPQCKGEALRETDVMDNFIDSSWYYLAYLMLGSKNPKRKTKNNLGRPFDTPIVKKWMPVDMYIGGAEHSVLHLLYTRFVSMALYDLGHVSFSAGGLPASMAPEAPLGGEPFKKFRSHGLITKDGAKMAKSKGNVVNPNDYIKEYGADALRLYMLFLGPYDQGGDFSDSGIKGATRFLERVWQLCTSFQLSAVSFQLVPERLAQMHKTIKAATEDFSNLRFNTAIAKLMTYVNFLQAQDQVSQKERDTLLSLVAPLAPHITEEIFQQGRKSKKTFQSIHDSPWPKFDKKYLVAETIKLAVQVNGKTRAVLDVAAGLDQPAAESAARQGAKVAKYLTGEVKKVIFIKDRLINFVL